MEAGCVENRLVAQHVPNKKYANWQQLQQV